MEIIDWYDKYVDRVTTKMLLTRSGLFVAKGEAIRELSTAMARFGMSENKIKKLCAEIKRMARDYEAFNDL
jgi:hypothetical protein